MGLATREFKNYIIVELKERVDAFNLAEVTTTIDDLVGKGSFKFAVNLQSVRFLSLPCIQYFSSLAAQLRYRGGQLILLSPSEKLRRQIDIFASLEGIVLFRSEREWMRVSEPTRGPAYHEAAVNQSDS